MMSRDLSKLANLKSLWVVGLEQMSVTLIMKISQAVSTKATSGSVMNSALLQELGGTQIHLATLKPMLNYFMIQVSKQCSPQELHSKILKKDSLKRKEVTSYGDLTQSILVLKRRFLVGSLHLTRHMVLWMNFNMMRELTQRMAQSKMILHQITTMLNLRL